MTESQPSFKFEARILPLSECTESDLVNHHAFVYGRCRIWASRYDDTRADEWHWSRVTWWKALWYQHRGEPKHTGTWGVYAGNSGHTGAGDAELTHFMRTPIDPVICAEPLQKGIA